MDIDTRQIILLLIAFLVPAFLLVTKRERWLLGWVSVTMFVQIFDTTIITNLPAGRIVGLLYLPIALKQGREWMQLKPIRAWMINLAYLVILGIAFGWIWPWPDITLSRPFTLLPQGRSIVIIVRMLSDFSLAIFIANQLKRADSLMYMSRALILGSTVTALAGLFYLATKIDLYYPITSLGEQGLLIDRARGLTSEPRVLGLCCAYGVMILLLGRSRVVRGWQVLLVIHLLALLITYSASSFALLGAGVLTAMIFFTNRERGVVIGTIVLLSLITAGTFIYAPDRIGQAVDTLQLRLDPNYKLSGIPQGTFAQEIAYRLDVFDASAMLFFLEEPLYALIGTGPGLITLPASFHVPPGTYSAIWTPEIGVNSPPSHGILLELSNSGVLGILLWIVHFYWCYWALRILHRSIASGDEKSEWKYGASLFIIGAVFYAVQVSVTPLWSLFLGIGWFAARIVDERSRRAAEPLPLEVAFERDWQARLAEQNPR